MADAFDLGGILEMDAGGFTSGASEAADASDDVSGATGEMSESLWDVEPAGVAAGAALAGIGTAAQGALDDTKDMRESLGRTSQDMGITSDEANELARSMSNATFPIEDVTGTMDTLARQGVETEEDMQLVATAADDIADATGTSAESVAENLGPAMKGLGDDLEDMPEVADAVTLAVRNTTLSTEDLTGVMERSRDELNEMGLDTQEAAGLIAEFGEETGLSGRQLRREFSQELRDADGDMDAFAENTGISKDALSEWEDQLDENTGATQEYADAANESVSTMDKVRSGFDDAKLAASGMLGPVDAIAPVMQTAGMASMTMASINTSAVIPSLVGVATAAAPVVVPLAAITAAVGALYLAWDNNWLGIQDRTDAAISFVRDQIGALPGWIGDQKDKIMAPINDLRDAFPGSIEEATDMATSAFESWDPTAIVSDKASAVTDRVDALKDTIPTSIGEVTDMASSKFEEWRPSEIVSRKAEAATDSLPSPSDWRDRAAGLASSFADGIRDNIPDVQGAVDSMTDKASDYLPSSDAKLGEFSTLTDKGRAVPETMATGVEQNEDELAVGVEAMAEEAEPSFDISVGSEEPSHNIQVGESENRRSRPSGRSRSRQRRDETLHQLLDEIRALKRVMEAPQQIEGELEINGRRFNELVDLRLERVNRMQKNRGKRGL